ncbi:MAG: insulinase family protein [Planctomycetes bacterium]|nr:insulinase family protein [Planctomycetota bacterium]
MRRSWVPLAALFLCARAAGAGALSFESRTETLENGLRVILIPLPSDGLVAYYSIVRTGSRDEVEPGRSGFAHFFEHMMFRGTETYPGPVYDRIVLSMGANANAYTTDDYTCYHLVFAREDLPRVIEIEADRFQNLSYAEREFQTEAGAVYGEYRKGKTSPYEVLFEALQEKAFDVHTYKHTTIGFEKDIAAMPAMYDYSKTFFERFYRPDNVLIVVAGDVDRAETLAEIRRRYGGWKPGYEAPAVPPEPPHTAERTLRVSYEGRSLPMLVVAWKGERFIPDDRTMVAGSLLGDLLFGETSDLYRRLVLEERIAQDLSADFGLTRDPGLWSVLALVSEEKDIDRVREAIDATVEAIRSAPPDPRRVEDLKRRARYGFLMGMDTPDHVAGGLARFIALSGGIDAVDAYFETLAAVRPEDAESAARAYLARERRTVGILRGVTP